MNRTPATFFSFAILFFGISVCVSAAADDGRIEINQLCVASGCFAGDDPGFPVEINNPGSYVLTSDLVVPGATNGIRVFADDTRIDLGGFAVSGPVECTGGNPNCSPTTSGFGISGSVRNLVVTNGSVNGFGQSCIALSGEGMLLRELAIANCGDAGINSLATGIVESVIVINNGTIGGFLDSDIIVRDSVFKNNGSSGVTFGICRDNLFTSNGDADATPEEQCSQDDGSNVCGVGSCP